MRTSFSRSLTSERALARLGSIVQEKYRIDRLLGIGGTAAVYAATHRNGHRVAIKFLLESLADDADIRHLFSREAYVANKVGHTGAVPVLDNDIGEDGCPFLIMPLLEGETVRARWERANRRLPMTEVAVLTLDALEVLASAHAKGIVHRDIKPDNLFVTVTGVVRVLDFGVARQTMGDGNVTFTGRLVGTPAFMPPEQACGQGDAIGPHSDVWAVGATIFSLLSGEFVHRADNIGAQLAAAASRPARSLLEVLPSAPPPVVNLVDKALAFEPANRWRSAQEMRRAMLISFESALGEPLRAVAPIVRARIVAELTPNDSHTTETLPPERSPRPTDDDMAVGIVASHPRPSDAPVPAAPKHTTEPIPPTLRDAHASPRKVRVSAPPKLSMDEPDAKLEEAAARQSPRLSRHVFNAIVALVCLTALVVGGVLLVGAHERVPSQQVAARVTMTSAEGVSRNVEAEAHLSAGLQHWRDGAERAAENSFKRALELDPASAAAHLYLAMLSVWANEETRAHHHAASAHRARLGPRDRVLLDAYAPSMVMPSDLGTTLERLLAARDAFPTDWLVRLALAETQIKRGDLQGAVDILDGLLREEPPLAMAWAEKGLALAMLDDVPGARASLKECIRISSYAENCLRYLVRLDSNEGQCADAERHARALMALPFPHERWATDLAGAMLVRGASMASVHDVIANAWKLAPESRREIVRHRHELSFQVLAGNFAQAQRAMAAWGNAVAGARYEDDHALLAKVQFAMARELNDPALAVRLASEYLSKREAWFASTYLDWEILPLRTQYLAGGLSRESFDERRRAWLAGQAAGPQFVDTLNLRWSLAYAEAVATPSDAEEALRVLPQYLPITDAISRDVEADSAIGQVYMLAGSLDKAVPYLQRGAGACDPLFEPFEHTWANLRLGMALQKSGDGPNACAAYRVVLARWGKEPRSISAKMARAGAVALRCK